MVVRRWSSGRLFTGEQLLEFNYFSDKMQNQSWAVGHHGSCFCIFASNTNEDPSRPMDHHIMGLASSKMQKYSTTHNRYSLTHNRNIMNHDELKAESDFISPSLAKPQDQSPQHWQSSYFRSEYLSLCQKIPNVDENHEKVHLLTCACSSPSLGSLQGAVSALDFDARVKMSFLETLRKPECWACCPLSSAQPWRWPPTCPYL